MASTFGAAKRCSQRRPDALIVVPGKDYVCRLLARAVRAAAHGPCFPTDRHDRRDQSKLRNATTSARSCAVSTSGGSPSMFVSVAMAKNVV